MQAEQSESGSSGVLPERITGQALLSCFCSRPLLLHTATALRPDDSVAGASARVTVPGLLSSPLLSSGTQRSCSDRFSERSSSLVRKGASSPSSRPVFFPGPVNLNVPTTQPECLASSAAIRNVIATAAKAGDVTAVRPQRDGPTVVRRRSRRLWGVGVSRGLPRF